MVKIIVRDMGSSEYPGKLTFKTRLGGKCCVNLPCLYDGLRVGYNGEVHLPPQIDFELLDLVADEIYVNVNSEFYLLKFELVIVYLPDEIHLKVVEYDR